MLIKLAYLGFNYHGSQIQPNNETIEGVIKETARRLFNKDVKIKLISRTDKFVSARTNIGFIDLKENEIWKLSSELLKKQICIWAIADIHRIPEIKERIYKYFYVGDVDEEKLKKILDLKGKIPLNYYKRDKKNPKNYPSKIHNIIYEDKGFYKIFTFKAKKFAWNEIRRIMGILYGKIAPAFGLILWDINFKEKIPWKENKKFLEYLSNKYKEEIQKALVIMYIGETYENSKNQ